MTGIRREQILPGVFLSYFRTDKFQTTLISVSMLDSVCERTAAENALLPYLLRRGNRDYPDMESLEAALDGLYGARIEPSIRKKGETAYIGFVGDIIHGRITPEGQSLTGSLISILCGLITKPQLEDGAFRRDYTESEKQKLIDRITAEINDKKSYATKRMIEIMCEGERFAISEIGTEKSAAAITPQSAYDRYEQLIRTAPIEIFCSSDAEWQTVADMFKKELSVIPRGQIRELEKAAPSPEKEGVKRVTERMDISQAKLSMGFTTGITANSPEYPAFTVANTVFGAGTSSKLFLNVREKMSLCYYAGSAIDKSKGIMAVSSGIDPKNFEIAEAEILRQLDDVKAGNISDSEFESAKAGILNSLRGIKDSQKGTEEFYYSQISAGSDMTLDALMDKIAQVKKEQLGPAAAGIKLNTVYFLCPAE